MKRTLAFGGLVATAGLLAAGLAVPAQAGTTTASDTLANTNFAAQQVASFWFGQAKANLLNATPYNIETQVASSHVSTGGPAADTKPGIVAAIGDEKKTTSTSKNVNLPRTVGKVFFVGADHKSHWCTATSVQSSYHNVVATAGHCVYDTKSNKATLDKWVFIPGYYQGKTPWGIYVGKTAYTHYDYDVYEDGDRDYAFVTVYNGVLPTEGGTTGGGYASEIFPTQAEADAAKAKLEADKTTALSRLQVVPVKKLASNGTVTPLTVAEFADYNKGKDLTGNGPWTENTSVVTTPISARDYGMTRSDKYISRDGKTLYFRTGHRYDTKYFKRTFSAKIVTGYQVVGAKLSIGLKDVGRLGDNVGGQGLAYNQKVGSSVFVFGYPSGSHPDGNVAYTGKTLKWSYGKTFAAKAPAVKGEELLGVKSSFTGEGSNGSSWLLQYKSARRLGYLNGVTIGVSDSDKNGRIDTSVSPYFDGETYGVYKSAAASWSGKIV